MKLNAKSRKVTLRAAAIAEKVLPYFEKERPGDHRPRAAIAAARSWARGGMKVGEARIFALGAHAAARAAKHPAAVAAARVAGHAAGTAHMSGHVLHAVMYAAKAELEALNHPFPMKAKKPATKKKIANKAAKEAIAKNFKKS